MVFSKRGFLAGGLRANATRDSCISSRCAYL